MTTLEFYTVLSATWVAIAWLPYVLDRILVRGLVASFANYSPDATPQSAWAQRAMRAHTIAVELLVCFAPLAILAAIKTPEDTYPGTLAMTFFFGLFAHYWIYVLGITVVRTLAFALAALSTLALGLRLLGVI